MGFSLGLGRSKKRSTSTEVGTQATTGTQTEQLDISQEGVDKIVGDVLGGEQGLAQIFSGEQTAGLFNSSVGAQAAGDLVANVTGEIAKLKAKRTTAVDETKDINSTTTGTSKSRGGSLGFG